MKLRRLWIDRFKNLRNCEVTFKQPSLLSAVIGENGSGKSNLVEALLQILVDVYFEKPSLFDFDFEYEAQGRDVRLSACNRKLKCEIDGQDMPIGHFARRLRDGDAQVYYPETTFAYYSGDCDRVQRQLWRYQRSFRRLVQKPEKDDFRPLFVLSTNKQARNILLALIAHRDNRFLKRLKISAARHVEVVLRSPEGFDPQKDEPKLWGTSGKVRKIIAAFHATAESEDSLRNYSTRVTPNGREDAPYRELRTYTFHEGPDSVGGLRKLADRLAGSQENLYLALEHLSARGILQSVEYELLGERSDEHFDFDQLSEGEKQLIAVVGAIRLTKQRDNLVLLDEPDTHLNPQWSWEYPEMLYEAFDKEQRNNSTVLIATHDPVMISGLRRNQVFLANSSPLKGTRFSHPRRHPRGQGIANLLCSSEFFGLPSSLDKETQKLMDERLRITTKEVLSEDDKSRLEELNAMLEILQPGISERDPEYVAFLRERHSQPKDEP